MIRRAVRPGLATAVALVLLGWVGSRFGSFTVGSAVFVLSCGAALTISAFARNRHRPVPAIRVRPVALAWSVPVLAFATLETVNLRLGSTYEHPTVSILMDGPLEHRPIRWVAIVLWLAVGWALTRR